MSLGGLFNRSCLEVLVDLLLLLEATRFLVVGSQLALGFVLEQLLLGEEDVHVVELAVVLGQTHGFPLLLRLALDQVPLQPRSWHPVCFIVGTANHVVVETSHFEKRL